MKSSPPMSSMMSSGVIGAFAGSMRKLSVLEGGSGIAASKILSGLFFTLKVEANVSQ